MCKILASFDPIPFLSSFHQLLLSHELQALVALAERADCDVRSCLNTLQFLAKRGQRIKVGDVMTLNMGQKDMTKGAFAVWTQLFCTAVSFPQPIYHCAT